ncbi:MAG: carboxypeptidase-like regulatory domain-containing protein [Longimicrobiales bacterium]
MTGRVSRLVLAGGAALAFAFPLQAQERPGRLVGHVVDHENGRPLAGARVGLRDSELEAVSDNQGFFQINDIPPGLHGIDVELIGYETRSAPLRVLPAQTLEAEIRMSTRPIELPPLEVSIRSPRLEDVGFYQRRDEFGSQGRFITRDVIERRNPQTMTDLLYNQPGIRVDHVTTGVRRVWVPRNQGCTPMLYIDGVRHDNRDFDVARPATIEGIEIYIGANLPIQYKAMTDCGAIVVWTRRGSRG